MKVLILAGGLGSRLSEETTLKPKPMIEIGEKPILWHIMKIYSYYGFNEFIIMLGYKGYLIKEYFANFFLHQNDVTINLSNNDIEIHNNNSEDWKVSLINTGNNTMTGARIKKVQKYTRDEPFLLTYGDGVADVNIKELVQFHKAQKKTVTMTAVQPEGRFGSLKIENDKVTHFIEKPAGDNSWINGGFFVCEPEVFNYINTDENTIFEREPLEKLALNGQLSAYKHNGFWKPMDTLRDKQALEILWNENKAKWKLW